MLPERFAVRYPEGEYLKVAAKAAENLLGLRYPTESATVEMLFSVVSSSWAARSMRHCGGMPSA